jgi:excisionase family DNA binding protein
MEDRIERLEGRIAALERIVGAQKLDADRLYTPAEAADWLRCGKTNIYDLMDSGDLAVTRVGAGKAGMRIWGSAIRSFLDDRTEGGPSPKGRFKHLRAYLP